ncbi:PQQ-binding-like beta-propeller repeat protein [Streptomyces lancefieldiae]|uniref:PQQ-binding-like beta-propeller repeat protein n=1 Tax=Streptomyces lancefieldiae TaxID=3075520 RepID=A0ABU3B1R0_9ACTN|nr:PQQ-binding-like beta-propeller repeat protein [Streptomyces sp. DSM 40712]MDT0616098.1 PQQ-binding-like beta-propeller repeat protein [Streptomyces sp. DSM 40712]
MAVGTGSYDGGYAFEGELLILDLDSERSTPVIGGAREVLHVAWESERVLRVVVAPPDDYDFDEAHTHGFAAVIERADWSDVAPGSVRQEELSGQWMEFDRPRAEDVADQCVESLAVLTGQPWWEPRRQVWDVQELRDGRVLACSDGVLAEAWLPDGQLEWCVPDEEGGRQLVVRAAQSDAWVNVERRRVRWVGRERVTEPPLVARVSLADGKLLGSLRLDSSVALTTREDGWLAFRPTAWDRGRPESAALIRPANEAPEVQVPLGGFDLFNHAFPIRHSGQLLFLQGKEREPWRDKWVVAVDPAGPGGEPSVRRLFPLDWDAKRARHLFGGPGIEVGTAGNRDLVHAGAVHDGAGLLPGNAFIVRRSLGDGAARWVFTADFPATALDGDNDTVYVAFNSGELVALRTSDGSVRWQQQLEVGGQRVVPLSLTLPEAGRLLIGTVDGRILDCSVADSAGQ